MSLHFPHPPIDPAPDVSDFYRQLHETGLITRLLELARDEDCGPAGPISDVTTVSFVPHDVRSKAFMRARQACIVAGTACIDEVLFLYRADVDCQIHVADGAAAQPGDCIATLSGNLRSILTAERVLLNVVSRLSGVATHTSAFVNAAKPHNPSILDTRKTTPGLRVLEKYAVRCGGGTSHRLGLHDAVLIKDNHLAALVAKGLSLAQAISHAASRARKNAEPFGLKFVMLEVDTIEQFEHVLSHNALGIKHDQADIVLLDNMSIEQLSQAVSLRNAAKVRVQLEASGGVTLESINRIAATGVDRISVGSLTRGATWVDIGLDLN